MSDGGAPLLDAFLGGLEASISVLLTLGYGVLAGHLGLVSEQTTKDVSKLCNKFFLPALLVVNVGSQLSMSNLDKYWPVLLWALTYILLSMGVAFLSVKMFKLPGWVTIACAFNNTTSLPLLLVQSLASTTILKSLLVGDETMSGAIERAKSYFLICSVIKNVLVIGLGGRLLKASDPAESEDHDGQQQQQDGHQQDGDADGIEANERSSLLPIGAAHKVYTANSKVHTFANKEFSRLPHPLQSVLSTLGALVNPASLGAVVAMIVGLIPFLHRAFFSDFEDGGWLKPWLTTSLQNVGGLFTALQMFVVGSMLNQSMGGTKKSAPLSKKALGFTFFIRFILWSLISIPLIYFLASRTTLLSDDPILWFTMMLMPIGPPAMILSTTLEVAGAPEEDQTSVAKVLMVFYGITPIICFAVVAALKAAEAAKSARGL